MRGAGQRRSMWLPQLGSSVPRPGLVHGQFINLALDYGVLSLVLFLCWFWFVIYIYRVWYSMVVISWSTAVPSG